ncbi:MAG: spore coat associated protein CotJA [Clostridiales bacterium]|nr:spore coat associated protein CotJA [Clostridiales bacterium]
MREYGISPLPEKITVAMAYVPYQINMGKTYSPQQASEAGTLFEELDKPFLGGAK